MQKHKLSTDGWRLCENEEMKLKLLLGLIGRLIESKDSILKRNKSFLLGTTSYAKSYPDSLVGYQNRKIMLGWITADSSNFSNVGRS